MQKKNYNWSRREILRLRWDIVVFRLVAYLLNMICFILQLLYKIARDKEHQIDVLYVSFNAWDSQVSF